MQPAVVVMLLSLVFGGTHVALASGPLRGPLVARLGKAGFGALFSAVAVVSFTALVAYYAGHRWEGAPGPDLGRYPAVRAILMAAIVAGVTLMFLMDYAKSPSALFEPPVRTPKGAERITRHPFFAGVAIIGLAHALLATRAVGTAFFTGLAALAIAGAWHQDRKLIARRGRPYAEYVAATSAVPFAAIVAGRQPLPRGEIRLRAFATGLTIAVLLRTVHASILSRGGAWVVGAVVLGAAISTLRAYRRVQRLTPASPVASAP